MKPPPYQINHIDLHKNASFNWKSLASRSFYLVFWWNKTPLGHLFSDEHPAPQNQKQWLNLVWKTILPTITYYAGNNFLLQPESSATFEPDEIFLQKTLQGLFAVSQSTPGPHHKISVVICTRNRPQLLKNCLNAFEKQTVSPYEIIVVDNGPEDGKTKEAVAAFPGVCYIPEPRTGLDYARNAGALAAKGDIVAFTDDDVQLHPSWIEQIDIAFNEPDIKALTGLVFAQELETEAQYLFEKYWSFNRGYQPIHYDAAYFKSFEPAVVPVWKIGAGANMAFRKNIFDALGGFDIRLDMGAAGCNGDSEYWYRILAEGWTIRYDPAVIAFHTHRKDIPALKKQIFQYLRGFTTAILVQQHRYGRKGGLHHLLFTLPVYYCRELAWGFRTKFKKRQTTIRQEIGGYFAGFLYYFRHKQELPFTIGFQEARLPEETTVQPLVSVIITTYNHAHYLSDSIHSVLTQTYRNIELIVVDDGSTDNTSHLMASFPGIQYLRKENGGLSSARNKGIEASSGQYLVFLDADDFLYPNAVATNLNYFKRYKEAAFIAGNHDKVNEEKKILAAGEAALPSDDFYKKLLLGNFIGMHAAVMYRKAVFSYFKYDTFLKACEDYDLYLRIARLFPVFCHQEKLAAYRIHGSNMSNDKALMAGYAQTVLKKHYHTLPIAIKFQLLKEGISVWRNYYAREVYRNIRYAQPKKQSPPGWKDLAFSFRQLPHAISYALGEKFLKKLRKKTTPVLQWIWRTVPTLSYSQNQFTPVPGKIHWGSFRKVQPMRRWQSSFAVQEYYLQQFQNEFIPKIKGNILAIAPAQLQTVFSFPEGCNTKFLIIQKHLLTASDLEDFFHNAGVHGQRYDGVIWLYGLAYCANPVSALGYSKKILKEDGCMAVAVPGLAQAPESPGCLSALFTFSGLALKQVLETVFEPDHIRVKSRGNVYAAVTNLTENNAENKDIARLSIVDPHIPVLVTAIVHQNLLNDTKQ